MVEGFERSVLFRGKNVCKVLENDTQPGIRKKNE